LTAPNPDQSRNWSGYSADGGTFTAVAGSWIVPRVSAPGSNPTSGTSSGIAGDATWVGIGGVQSRDLIQAGTEATVVGPGRAVYDAWIEQLPQASHPMPLVVSPGDSVTFSIARQTPGEWTVAAKNNTTGQSYQTQVSYDSSLSSAEWVEEAPSGGRRQIPLDDFGMVQFSGGSAVKNGTTVTIAQAGARPITMIDRGGKAVATPSSLGGDGGSFSVSRA
jgi:hypothetical protein